MFNFITERRSNRIISNTFINELNEVPNENRNLDNSVINNLINSNDEFVNTYLGLCPFDEYQTQKNNFKFIDNFDNLSTITEEYSDTMSISSNDSTIVFEIKNTKKNKLINKLKRFFFINL